MENRIGRPLKWNPEQVETAIKEYFTDCDAKNLPKLQTGICLKLGMSRESWREYGEKPVFVDIIKKAKMICEHDLFQGMLKGKWNVTAGIFGLKNHYDWKDTPAIGFEQHTHFTFINPSNGDKPKTRFEEVMNGTGNKI